MTESDQQHIGTAPATGRQPVEPSRREHIVCAISPRQLSVLRELAKVRTNKEIGKALALSPETVNHHLKTIFSRLGVSTREDAVAEARRRGIIVSY